jgi:hypothetical protein
MPAGAPPRLAGGGQLKIGNWRTIGAFTGARISGQPAQLNFTLEHSTDAGRGQSLTADWKADSISLYQEADGSQGIQTKAFDVSSMEGKLDVTRLFQMPRVQLDLKAGRGGAGALRWRSGLAKVSTEQDEGNFELALYGWHGSGSSGSQSDSAGSGQSGQPRQRVQDDSTPGPGSELVALGGAFNLAGPTLDLKKFELHSADYGSHAVLATPARLDFSQGLQLKELRLDLTAQVRGDSIPLRRRGQQGSGARQADDANRTARTEKAA